MPKPVKLTDKFVASLPNAATGKRDFHVDALVPAFGVRVTDKGVKSWSIYRRWPPYNKPAHLKIGDVAKVSLADARTKARKWIELAEKGKDPKQVERDAILEEQKKRAFLFGDVAEQWLASPGVKDQRKLDEVQRDVRREFISVWAKRPITSITEAEISKLISSKAAHAPSQARNQLGYVKRLFKWARNSLRYGLDVSPAERLMSKDLCGKKKKRKHTLNDAELRVYWQAALAMPYPYGKIFAMLALTGQRENEVGAARWREFDMRARIWSIPPERMKMDEPHEVPICDDLMALLGSLTKFNKGDCLFSFNNGKSSVNGWGKAKHELDDKMAEIAPDAEIRHFVIHDIRRTARTAFAKLKIPSRVAEAMIAHAAKGEEATYNQHAYVDEKREGFALWESALRKIVAGPPTG
jgi:integrase